MALYLSNYHTLELYAVVREAMEQDPQNLHLWEVYKKLRVSMEYRTKRDQYFEAVVRRRWPNGLGEDLEMPTADFRGASPEAREKIADDWVSLNLEEKGNGRLNERRYRSPRLVSRSGFEGG